MRFFDTSHVHFHCKPKTLDDGVEQEDWVVMYGALGDAAMTVGGDEFWTTNELAVEAGCDER